MACAVVLMNTLDRELSFEPRTPPLVRSMSNLESTSSLNVTSLSSQLSQSTSKSNRVQTGLKRKRQSSVDTPAKRRRLLSVEEQQGLNEPPSDATGDLKGEPINESLSVTGTGIHEVEMEIDDNNQATVESTASPEQATVFGAEPAMQVENASGSEGVTDQATNEEETMCEGAEGGAAGGAAGETATANRDPQFENDYQLICEIHPAVDPTFIHEQLTLSINDPDRVSKVIFAVYSHPEPPSREDREAKELVGREYERLFNLEFDLSEFLNRYPDPLKTFDVRDTDVTEIYYDHSEVFLKNEFRYTNVKHIRKVLQKNGFHLMPAYNILKPEHDAFLNRGTQSRYNRGSFRLSRRSAAYEYPVRDCIDEDFFWERLFLLNQEEILGHLAAVKEAKQMRIEEARKEGRLRDCAICVSSDVFIEDMVPCTQGHLFCMECVRRSTEALLGEGRAKFPCLDIDCACEFSLSSLELALQAQTFSLVVRRVQAEQIRLAQIENIVSCPFCPYSVIIPDDISSSVFHCENPDCMEDSCRMCQQIAHTPFSCEEFKAKREEQYAHFVENEMAEAMIRNCPKCNLRFYKEQGCNNMRCNCGTSMCYICRQVITNGYQHFRNSKECSNYNDIPGLHKQEVTKAFNEAEAKYRANNPELSNTNINLRVLHNPQERPCIVA